MATAAGIAVADFEIDVAHRRIERAGIGVGDVVVGRHGARRRKAERAYAGAVTPGAGTRAGEHHHDAHALLKARRVVRQHEDGARCAIAEDSHARPDIDGAREPVTARGDEHDAFAGVVVGLVDRRLDGGAVVGFSIGVDSKLLGAQINGLGIIQPGGNDGCGEPAEQTAEDSAARNRLFFKNPALITSIPIFLSTSLGNSS